MGDKTPCLKLEDGCLLVLQPFERGQRTFCTSDRLEADGGEIVMARIVEHSQSDHPGFLPISERLNFTTGQPAGTPPWR